ncbi:tRNA (adenine(37)-N6)-methyltransferase [Amia ocellicauda]|uniref:tRNA (adenine(37)-N6)-methyltransferase n=1 Tax=Amia ocellicauda TaxID=2972642 RepID=UPI003464AEF5
MSGSCSCREHLHKLQHQISVMRKEIKNLRQLTDGAVRSHRKNLSSLQSVLMDIKQEGSQMTAVSPQTDSTPLSLEQGTVQTLPIGYIESCFSAKNGTPRQPTICSLSRASLQIRKSVFNNPEHSLLGLDQYSHVWIIFLFHKNGHLNYKAKVKPPRLNGLKTGVFSTRSPHRPNAIGLTLARLESITGDTLHLSGVDMIAGTPILDIKPYIPDYDSPLSRTHADTAASAGARQDDSAGLSSEEDAEAVEDPGSGGGDRPGTAAAAQPGQCAGPSSRAVFRRDESKALLMASSDAPCASESKAPAAISRGKDVRSVLAEISSYVSQEEIFPTSSADDTGSRTGGSAHGPGEGEGLRNREEIRYGEESYTSIASWIRQSPVSALDVRFTPHAERDLKEFRPPGQEAPGKPCFRFLRSPEEAAAAIGGVLSADPRSVYRRARCLDQLFHFCLDTAHVTCWFGDGFAEVLRVTPAPLPEGTSTAAP